MPLLPSSVWPHGALRIVRLWSLLLVVLQGLSACASLPPPPPRTPTQALAEPQATALGKRVAAVQPAANLSGFRVVTSGTDALAVLMTLADQAERTLDLQYYLVHNEASTRALLQHVRAAADRGVRVRLLVDDMHTAGNDDALLRMTRHPRIEVRLYNPLPSGRFSTITKVLGSLHDVSRINRRMHNKMFVADNALAFSGGRNLGDAYFLQSDKANFVDMDLLVAGPAVRALSRSFDRYWNSELAYPVEALVSADTPAATPASAASTAAPAGASAPQPQPALDAPPPAEPTIGMAAESAARDIAPGGRLRLQWAPARLLADDPAKIENGGAEVGPDQTMFDDVASLLRSARREVLIISPYLVPGQRGMAVFHELRQRGVMVRVLTSSLAATDAPVVHAGYSRYRRPMLQEGIELYELRPQISAASARLGAFGQSRARLHAKALVVDGRWLLVGSMNLDPRSIDLNSEIGLLLNSPALAEDFRRLFDDVVQNNSYRLELRNDTNLRWVTQSRDGPAVVEDSEPESTFLRRLSFWLMAPIAPEEML
ncbi:phospholipase D family protein [Ideonella sp. BN130291]|uniref:phospholipase D family protein n=1 Tax=Ideonella sp. BN130291 TaxID=3112940 RepID=UPI002E25D19E|nr:phospholipase D family protein [Ideonella sp. BN130291]